MKNILSIVALMWVPLIAFAQEPTHESIQRKSVASHLKSGDSLEASDLNAVCNLSQGQEKQIKKEPPKDYVPYDTAPDVIKQVQPIYPELALRAGLEGTVWISVWIDELGNVAETKLMKSDAEIFNQSSLEAAKQWKFKPALRDHKPIATWVAIPFKFKHAGKRAEQNIGKLTGNVLDMESGRPIPEATVVVVGTTLVDLTDGMGRYAISGLRDGPNAVLAVAAGYAPIVTNNVFVSGVKAKAGISTTQNFLLRRDISEEKQQYDDAPEATKQVDPKYPDSAMKDGLEGDVMVKLWLDEAGNVTKTEVVKRVRKDLDDAALAAAQGWRFKPAKKNGKPIAVWITIPFRFKISGY